MGACYGTIYLRTTDRDRVRAVLERLASNETQFLLAPVLRAPGIAREAEQRPHVVPHPASLAVVVAGEPSDVFDELDELDPPPPQALSKTAHASTAAATTQVNNAGNRFPLSI